MNVLDNGPFILCGEELLVITISWSLELLTGEFS